MVLDSKTLLDFLQSDLDLDSDETVDDETLLFSSGLLDSFAMVTLVGFVEKQGGVRLTPGDVNLNNLDSIGRVLRFVEKKKAR